MLSRDKKLKLITAFLILAAKKLVTSFFRSDAVGVKRSASRTDCCADQSAFSAFDQTADQRPRAGRNADVNQIAVTTVETRSAVGVTVGIAAVAVITV